MKEFILTGDIGGTNTSIALVERDGEKFTMTKRQVFESKNLTNVTQALNEAIKGFQIGYSDVKGICLSPAGPIVDNYCKLTNLPWGISGAEVSKETGAKCILINDFSAICYALAVLDTENPTEIHKLYTPEHRVKTFLNMRTALGAGTGLGIGHLMKDDQDGIYKVLPGEGGHTLFPVFDKDSYELQKFIKNKVLDGQVPDAEYVVAGQGIKNIFLYLLDKHPYNETLNSIKDAADIPKEVSILAHKDNEICLKIMEIFVKAYAKIAANVAFTMLPWEGLYIGGGIAAKNLKFFEKDNLFINTYLEHSRPIMRDSVLKSIPIYVIKQYEISSVGAALGFVSLYSRYYK